MYLIMLTCYIYFKQIIQIKKHFPKSKNDKNYLNRFTLSEYESLFIIIWNKKLKTWNIFFN